MKSPMHQIRVCENPDCGLRFPVSKDQTIGERCPICLGQTSLILTASTQWEEKITKAKPSSIHIEGMLDNIRSALNVGSIFRTADGFGLRRLYLCGITATPESPELRKSALGAELSVPWIHHPNSVTAAKSLRDKGANLWALEDDSSAESIFDLKHDEKTLRKTKSLIIIAGNEETGVDPELLNLSQRIFYIPMRGAKNSFNVAVAFGIALGVIINNYQ
jgi:23S rRNA (guanosine2251-2'-O)-methyltransferase